MARRRAREEREAMLAARTPQEIRLDVRNYIQNDRDTILRKWMALEQAVKSEDFRRDNFYKRKMREDTKTIPLSIRKFIGTLKKAVRNTMKYKGGTPFSIIRAMFLYWDADKSGEISSEELKGCMNALGVKMTDAERDEVVDYYDSGNNNGTEEKEMTYTELLSDITIGEPTIIEDAGHTMSDSHDDIEHRYEEVLEVRPAKTKTIDLFLEATRYWVMFRMRVEGGTPYYHIRNLFQFYDYDYSTGLNWEELVIATKKGMKLTITDEQAKEIVKYYDLTGNGDMQYQDFLRDVATFVKPVLHYTDITYEERQAEIESIRRNPFMPVPFKAPPNKILENFKRKITCALADRVNFEGGTVVQWLKEAFIYWDRQYTRRIKDWKVLQGVGRRIGIDLDEEDCHAIIANYDKWGTGEMHYMELLKDMSIEEGDFLREPEAHERGPIPPTSRTPNSVLENVRRFKHCVETYARKSQNVLSARDLLHGSFLRFDKKASGRCSVSVLTKVCNELGIGMTHKELNDMILWFDTDGTRQLDYNAFTDQVFGSQDIMTRQMTLPKLHKLAGSSSFNLTQVYKGAGTSEGSGDVANKKDFLIESNKVKQSRLNEKRTKVYSERRDVLDKLNSVDAQREQIIQAYKDRHQAKRDALKRPPPQVFGLRTTNKAMREGSRGNSGTATMQQQLNLNLPSGRSDRPRASGRSSR